VFCSIIEHLDDLVPERQENQKVEEGGPDEDLIKHCKRKVEQIYDTYHQIRLFAEGAWKQVASQTLVGRKKSKPTTLPMIPPRERSREL
jgi:hypothetical protein